MPGAGDGIAIPGLGWGAGAAGALMSMSGMAAGAAGRCAGARSRIGRDARLMGAFAGFFRVAAVFGLALDLAPGLAGIFMPGIVMPPFVWAIAMPGSIATAAAAASHRVRIIAFTPWIA